MRRGRLVNRPECAELIAGESTVRDGRQEPHQQRCRLAADDWCATCNFYVCSDHAHSRHEAHSRTEAPLDVLPPETPHGERRSGPNRRRADR